MNTKHMKLIKIVLLGISAAVVSILLLIITVRKAGPCSCVGLKINYKCIGIRTMCFGGVINLCEKDERFCID